jgi:localization factor PodJL
VSAAAPWSVKGIDPKAREIAKDLARRSGMTLGEWLNTMIMDDDDDGVTPLPRRSPVPEIVERRGRSRRLDDVYGQDDVLQRVAASVDAMAARLEAAERRSTTAIAGIDQAVSGLVRRLDGADQTTHAYGRRIDDIAEDLREGHKRLRRFEQDVGPKTTETFQKVESAMGALAGRLYDIEERQRSSINELRQRVDTVEREGPQGLLGHLTQRLDQAQAGTSEALRTLERSFAGLDDRLRRTETRGGDSEAARFEKLAETLSRQVASNRDEMLRRLETAAAEGRIDKMERAVHAVGEQIQTSERRSAAAVEAMGKEVLRIAQNLHQRMIKAEAQTDRQSDAIGRQVSAKVEQDMVRMGQAIEQRLIRADDQHAMAIEKLGGEISRISERLAERIGQSERRSQQALEDISQRLSQSSEKIEQRYDRASGELAERMRMSEERTARLLAEARESIERRVSEPRAEARIAEPAVHSTAVESPVEGPSDDWRAAAFPDAGFDPAGWSGALLDEFDTAHVASSPTSAATAMPLAASADRIVDPVLTPTPMAAAPFGGFGGADVDDALEASDLSPVTPAPLSAPVASTFGVRTEPPADDDYSAETEFVDPRADRTHSTRSTIEAARAAMASAPAEPTAGLSLGGLKRGGKSRLQERLDKQARKDGSTVKKALLASVTAVSLTLGVAGYMRVTDPARVSPGVSGDAEATPLAAALIATPTSPTPQINSEAAALYEQAVAELDAGQAEGLTNLTRAANLGHAPAQFHLARLYETGEAGLDQDMTEARTWTERAARGGEVRAMHNLGLYLFDGAGGARNQAEAARWFQQASERGLTDSQFNLGRLYEQGAQGVPADMARAYQWYLIAGRAGDEQAQTAADRLALELTAGARRQARTVADAFTAEPIA